MIRAASCGIIGKEGYETFAQSLTLATVDDILRYVRYVAGEEAVDIELPGSFFVYIGMVHFAKRPG